MGIVMTAQPSPLSNTNHLNTMSACGLMPIFCGPAHHHSLPSFDCTPNRRLSQSTLAGARWQEYSMRPHSFNLHTVSCDGIGSEGGRE